LKAARTTLAALLARLPDVGRKIGLEYLRRSVIALEQRVDLVEGFFFLERDAAFGLEIGRGKTPTYEQNHPDAFVGEDFERACMALVM